MFAIYARWSDFSAQMRPMKVVKKNSRDRYILRGARRNMDATVFTTKDEALKVAYSVETAGCRANRFEVRVVDFKGNPYHE